MRYPKLRELKEAVTALIKGPYTTKFPFEPHKPAEKFRGKPVPDDDWCVGCRACAEVCPSGAIEVIDEPEAATRRIIRHYDKCIFCGQCELNCTTEKGVHLTDEYDLATFDRKSLFYEQKFELLICERCGRVIGTKKHLLWLARRLGPLAYSNFPLILTVQRELKIAKAKIPSRVPPTKPASPSRSDIFRILCPGCRHEVLLFDQYGKSL
ncbi:MAG: 4Fe-4S dicluster domain-containing protein [Candidatus Latescibacteria bacterium]|nr:4Fe-4S dicluster domain-containing protein [Candidatus Latescibacterota bacterium]